MRNRSEARRRLGAQPAALPDGVRPCVRSGCCCDGRTHNLLRPEPLPPGCRPCKRRGCSCDGTMHELLYQRPRKGSSVAALQPRTVDASDVLRWRLDGASGEDEVPPRAHAARSTRPAPPAPVRFSHTPAPSLRLVCHGGRVQGAAHHTSKKRPPSPRPMWAEEGELWSRMRGLRGSPARSCAAPQREAGDATAPSPH